MINIDLVQIVITGLLVNAVCMLAIGGLTILSAVIRYKDVEMYKEMAVIDVFFKDIIDKKDKLKLHHVYSFTQMDFVILLPFSYVLIFLNALFYTVHPKLNINLFLINRLRQVDNILQKRINAKIHN